MKDQKLYDAVNAVKNRGGREVQGRLDPDLLHQRPAQPGALSIDELEKIIKPILGA